MFDVTPKQHKLIKKFMKEQEKVTGGEYGAIGGGYTYKFTPTGLGVILVVENCVTKANINVTDFDSW